MFVLRGAYIVLASAIVQSSVNKYIYTKCSSENPGCRKSSHSSEMQNDVLKHREGLKGECALEHLKR